MEIVVTQMQMGAVAGFLRGYVVIEGVRAPFKAVAYGRFGGQNVSITFTPKGRSGLRSKGLDPEDLALHVQHLIVQGQFKVDDSVKPPSPTGL
ncbi:MAG TPA: hypothetical protein VMS77_09160 [Conexivisphaerales archaeon]|nr:hypothetical protein [Conexivisphaerales archaeon]